MNITMTSQRRRSLRHAFLLLAVLLVAGACSGDDAGASAAGSVTTQPAAEEAEPAPDDATPEAGETAGEQRSYAGTEPAPEFPTGLDWINTEDEISLFNLRGKVVLLDFWTYGCINCIHVIPDLKRLEEEFADELVVVGVHSAKFANESATENIRQVVLRYGVAHPVVNDGDFEIWRSWGVNAWPTTVLIDPAGNVVGGHSGEGVYDVTAPVVRSLIDEFDTTGQLDRTPLDLALEQSGQPRRILLFPGKVEAAENDDRIFIADTGHHRIIMTDRTGNALGVFGSGEAGFVDGPAAGAQFESPQGMALAQDGMTLYVADTSNHAIRTIDTTTGEVGTLLGTGAIGWPPTPGFAPDVGLNSPWDVEIAGDLIYIAMAGHHQIWVMDLANGAAQPLVGNAREGVLNGFIDQAELAQPSGLALADDGRLFFADSESSSIRVADLGPVGGLTGLVAGGSANLFEFGDEDGFGAQARFQHPLGVAIWESDQSLIVADTYNSRLRRIDPSTGETTTWLGGDQGWRDGTDAQFYEPGGIAIDRDTLYVADTNNHAIRIVDLETRNATTLVIKGIEAFEPPPGSATYRGTLTQLAEAAVRTGSGTLVLDVALPAGYKVNEDAPSSLSITAAGSEPDVFDLTGVTFPVEYPTTFTSDGDLVADVNLVYCRDDAESLCLFEQVRFIAPVVVRSDTAAQPLILEHQIVLPDLGG